MKLLMLAPYAPARDGIADYTAALRGGLVAAGHDVRVIAARSGEPTPAEVVGSLDDFEAALGRADIDGRPEVIHLQFAVATYGTGLPRLLRLMETVRHRSAKVVTMHEVTRDLDLLGPAGRTIYRRVASWADRIIVHTDEAKRRLIEIGVVPHCIIRVPHLRPELPTADCSGDDLRRRHRLGEAPIALAFGFIHIDKGLPVLIRAMARDGVGPVAGARLVVAGGVRRRHGMFRLFELNDRRHLTHVRRLVRGLGLADRVVFTGYVPAGEVASWFAAANVVVLPYRRIEQSGVAALAAAAKRPVIVTTVGGLAEDAGAVAATFPAGDHERLADLLPAFLERQVELPAPELPASLAEVVTSTVAVYEACADRERSWAHAG